MKIITLACAELSILDSNTNKISLINIHDEIISAQFPVLVPQFSILAITEFDSNDEQDIPCNIGIFLNEAKIMDAPVPVTYQGNKRHRTMITLQGLVLKEAGNLSVKFSYNDKDLATKNIPITEITQNPRNKTEEN